MHPDKNNTKISVIMPTFNHAHFLNDSISSVLNQTFSNFELIIIDNYSTDNTEKIVSAFNDSRIKYMKFKNNGIIAASRNFGIQHAEDEYIAFIDSDDTWEKNKLDLQIEQILNDSELGLCFGLFKVSTNSSKINGPKNRNIEGIIYKNLIHGNFIPSSSVLTKKNILQKLSGFNESKSLVGVEDYELWLRIAKKYKAKCIPEVVGTYTEHDSNLSKQLDIYSKRKIIIDMQRKEKYLSFPQAELIKSKITIHQILSKFKKQFK